MIPAPRPVPSARLLAVDPQGWTLHLFRSALATLFSPGDLVHGRPDHGGGRLRRSRPWERRMTGTAGADKMPAGLDPAFVPRPGG